MRSTGFLKAAVLAACALGSIGALVGCPDEAPGTKENSMATTATTTTAIPAIDAAAPIKLETATFAVG